MATTFDINLQDHTPSEDIDSPPVGGPLRLDPRDPGFSRLSSARSTSGPPPLTPRAFLVKGDPSSRDLWVRGSYSRDATDTVVRHNDL